MFYQSFKKTSKAGTGFVLAIVASAFIQSSAIAQDGHAEDAYIPDGYSIDTIKTPADVPFHIAGLDACGDGKLYAAIRLGEVWALDNSTKNGPVEAPQWKKFADGLTEPTGLLCEDDGSILVAHKPELTKLVDLDADGVADEYINLADQWDFHDNYHEFNFGPVKDKEGNYYGTLNLSHAKPGAFSLGGMSSSGGYRGWAYKVTPEGEFIPYASGLRSPAGVGSSPSGEIFYTDNQGDWVGTSKMHIIEEGKFYGHPVSLRDHPDYTIEKITSMTPEDFAEFKEDAVVWIPHKEVANSPGNPEWNLTGGKFGPFEGQVFVADQTQSNVFRVLMEKVNGQYQGAVINFINGFQSGNIRAVFDDHGQLWLGQTSGGWSSKGGKPFGLERAVWDGKTQPFELDNINITETGFRISFTKMLDVESVNLDSFSAEEWHYKYNGNYGSPKTDQKALGITGVELSDDKKSVDIKLPVTAGKVVAIDFSGLLAIDAKKASVTKIYYTVNSLLSE